MEDDRNVARNPATEEEKTILRNFVARDATPEERDSFLVKNYAHLNEKARGVFQEMSPTDQYRVIFDGPMKESRDPVEILYGRVKRFLDMELQLRALSGRTGKEKQVTVKKQPSKKMQELSAMIAHSLDNPIYEEVPAHERRCAGVDQKFEDAKPKVMEGTVKGIGGVIEALQKKYAMHKGERVKVLGEATGLWKVEGERTIPKAQVGTGWKWVIKGAEEEAKKKAEDDAKKKAAKEEAKRKAAEAKKPDDAKEEKPSKDGKKKDSDKKGGKEPEQKKEKVKEKDKSKEKEKDKAKSKDKTKEQEKVKAKKSEEPRAKKKRKHSSYSDEEEEASSASTRKRPKKKGKSPEKRQKSRGKSQKHKRRRSSGSDGDSS